MVADLVIVVPQLRKTVPMDNHSEVSQTNKQKMRGSNPIGFQKMSSLHVR